MEIHIDWLAPFTLRDGRNDLLTYTFEGIDSLSNDAGIYVFGRRHGQIFTPLYIGKAENLSRRISQQLNNNRLMNALAQAPSGQRELLIGELHAKRGQQTDRVLRILESGLIKLALAQGNDIFNVHGTRIQSHTTLMTGNRLSRSWLPARELQFE